MTGNAPRGRKGRTLAGGGVALAVALALQAMGAPPSRSARADDEPRMRRIGVVFSPDRVPQITFSARDLLDREGVREKLRSGLTQTVVMRAWARTTSGGTVARSVRVCSVTYDIWEEAWRVTLRGSGRRSSRRVGGLEDVVTACLVARSYPVGTPTDWRTQGGRRLRFAVLFELNPLSGTTVRRIRRWLSQPGGGGGLDRGDAFFGSFVAMFVDRRVGSAEATLRFRSQEVTVP